MEFFNTIGKYHWILWLTTWCYGEESICQCRRHDRRRFKSWVGKIPWSRKWQSDLVFLLGKFHGQRKQVGYRPWGHKGSDMTEQLSTHIMLAYVFTSKGKGM